MPGLRPQAFPSLHMTAQMLQVMENAWLGIHLEGFHAHPLNRGWMSVFRRWSSSAAFQECWPFLRGEFGQDFVRFCEQQLSLRTTPARACGSIRAANGPRWCVNCSRSWPRNGKKSRRRAPPRLVMLTARLQEMAKVLPDTRPRPFVWRNEFKAALDGAAAACVKGSPGRPSMVCCKRAANRDRRIDRAPRGTHRLGAGKHPGTPAAEIDPQMVTKHAETREAGVRPEKRSG